MNEAGPVYRWVREKLLADSTLMALVGSRVHRNRAPQGFTGTPLIVSDPFGSTKRGVGTARIMSVHQVDVKVVGRESEFVTMEQIMNRVQADLDGQSGATTGAVILSCVLEDYFDYPDQDEFEHYGGTFRIEAIPA